MSSGSLYNPRIIKKTTIRGYEFSYGNFKKNSKNKKLDISYCDFHLQKVTSKNSTTSIQPNIYAYLRGFFKVLED